MIVNLLSALINGVQRHVDLSVNTLQVGALKTGTNTLTDVILGNLISLQNGSEVGATLHKHDTIYTRTTALASAAGGTSGSTLIGDDASYSNFTPAAATVKGALSGIDTALASSTAASALDGTFRIKNTADNTKQIAFDASPITTSTTRTITMANANVDLNDVNNAILKNGSRAFTANQPMATFKFTGLGAGTTTGDSVRYEQVILTSGVNPWTGNQDLGGNKITGSADPTSAQDLATKAYIDAVALGLSPKKAVLCASTANLTLSGEQTIDGQLTSTSRVLVKDQTLPANNGIYITAAGAWTRSTDFDSVSPIDEINGAWVPVQFGTVNAGRVYVQYGTVVTVGTDPINFEFYNPIASLIGGDMITVSGSTISVDLATVSGLESTNPGVSAGQLRIKLEASNPSLKFTGSNELAIKFDPAGAILASASGTAVQVDNSSIEINTNALRIKALGVTLGMLAANSVDENKIVSTSFSASGAITGGSGTKIAAQVDGSTLEISTNQIRQKDAGTTAAKLNTNVADQTTITGGAGSALAVAQSPKFATSEVAGQSFAATTVFAVRYAKAADAGFVAGRVYKADYDTTSADNFYAIGLVFPAGAVSTGGAITVVEQGLINVTAHGFTVGQPIYLSAAGALTSTAPSTSLQAVVKVGMAKDANNIYVKIDIMGVN